MRRLAAFALLLSLALPAQATEITLTLPEEAEVTRERVAYRCADFDLEVEYVNAGPAALAVFSVDGESIIASNVLAASGAKYAGGRYIWWTKGSDGDLYDLMEGEDAAPVASCSKKS